tara:strand:- start:39 stop:152 length:114 start_codon:yes stop_codon:yes gene_type:complete
MSLEKRELLKSMAAKSSFFDNKTKNKNFVDWGKQFFS